ncbi:MAG: patatin-like phospholipase family protein [Rhodospirillaceae bacterium]|nr:patatin-like phospholipase family protein [Rhodospirillaceae bacterium]
MARPPRIGLALGSGGARGFAHLVVLEAFDELGLKPSVIAGSSMGALLGAAYAAGVPAAEIKSMVEDLYASPDGKLLGFLMRRDFLKYADLIDPAIKHSGLIRGTKFLNFMLGHIKAKTFADLRIPFAAVATNFWRHAPETFHRGPLLPALKASMAAPFVFTPEQIGESVYVDGALSNPVPWDVVAGAADIVVAVNVTDDAHEHECGMPTFGQIVAEYQGALTRALVEERRKRIPPDIYLAPQLPGISGFDFFKVKEVYRMALPVKDQLKRELAACLATRRRPRRKREAR